MMRKLLNKFLSRRRGEDFQFDDKIPFNYLLCFIFGILVKYLRGIFTFWKLRKIILIGHKTKVKARSKIQIKGRNLGIDRNVFINALSVEGIRFGNNVSIHKNVIIECSGSIKKLGKGLEIGDNVGIGCNSFLGCAGGIKIGSDTIFGNFVSVHSENHNFKEEKTPIRLQGVSSKGILIGKNCWIGAKVTILDGTILGDGCVVAAGAVLNGKAYPENSIIAGIPAKCVAKRF